MEANPSQGHPTAELIRGDEYHEPYNVYHEPFHVFR